MRTRRIRYSRRNKLFPHLFALSLLLIAGMPIPLSNVQAQEPRPAAEPEKRLNLEGYTSMLYVLRSARVSGDRSTDNDIFTRLRLDTPSSSKGLYALHFSGMGKVDMDGNQDRLPFYPFEDVDDTWNSQWNGYIYEALIDLNFDHSYLKQVRVGRQSGTRDDLVFFDGVSADVEALRNLQFTVCAGRPVHFYEENAGSDLLYGIGADYSPRAGTKVSVDYLYAEDEREVLLNQENNRLSFKVRHRFCPFSNGMIKYRVIDGKARDLAISLANNIPWQDLIVNVDYWKQLRSQRELANEFSLYFDSLGISHPYQSFDVDVTKIFSDRYALNVGFSTRDLVDDDDEGTFSREYDRIFAVFEMTDIPKERMTVAVSGERWQGSEDADSIGLDLGYEPQAWREGSKVNFGTYYSLYKYDYYFDPGEKADVRTYYVKTKIPLRENLSGHFSYEFEDGQDDYQVLKARLQYEF